jgi:hypothetical protein
MMLNRRKSTAILRAFVVHPAFHRRGEQVTGWLLIQHAARPPVKRVVRVRLNGRRCGSAT